MYERDISYSSLKNVSSAGQRLGTPPPRCGSMEFLFFKLRQVTTVQTRRCVKLK